MKPQQDPSKSKELINSIALHITNRGRKGHITLVAYYSKTRFFRIQLPLGQRETTKVDLFLLTESPFFYTLLVSIILNCQIVSITICLTKTTAAQNEDALNYHKVCGLYFMAVVFVRSISLCGSCNLNT